MNPPVNIEITLRGITPLQLATISAFLGGADVALKPVETSLTPSQVFGDVGAAAATDSDAKVAKHYADNLAASVFGGKGAPQTPNVSEAVKHPQQGVYQSGHAQDTAPAGATAQSSPQNQPAQSAAGGTPGGVELDADNYPWDGRIHSSSREKVAKTKTWKLLRGIEEKSPGLVAQVRAEYRSQHGAQVTAQTQANVTRFNDRPVDQAPAAQAAYQPYTPPGQAPGLTFQIISDKITGAIASGKVAGPVAQGMLNHFGVATLPDLANHPEKFEIINSEIERLAGTQS